MLEPVEVQYAQSGDLSIAYSVFGNGVRRELDQHRGREVNTRARVCGLAGADEVLVTSTVRDLVVGSGIEFADRGRHELKGVPGDRQVLPVQE